MDPVSRFAVSFIAFVLSFALLFVCWVNIYDKLGEKPKLIINRIGKFLKQGFPYAISLIVIFIMLTLTALYSNFFVSISIMIIFVVIISIVIGAIVQALRSRA